MFFSCIKLLSLQDNPSKSHVKIITNEFPWVSGGLAGDINVDEKPPVDKILWRLLIAEKLPWEIFRWLLTVGNLPSEIFRQSMVARNNSMEIFRRPLTAVKFPREDFWRTMNVENFSGSCFRQSLTTEKFP